MKIHLLKIGGLYKPITTSWKCIEKNKVKNISVPKDSIFLFLGRSNGRVYRYRFLCDTREIRATKQMAEWCLKPAKD